MQVLPSPTLVLRAVLLGSFYLVPTALKVCCLVLRRWRGLDTAYLTPLTGSRGVSVIIPHHDDLEMLQECLASVIEAARQVSEPVEVIVVANGANAARYAGLEQQFPSVRWFFFPALLEFAGAIRCGLEVTRPICEELSCFLSVSTHDCWRRLSIWNYGFLRVVEGPRSLPTEAAFGSPV